MHKVLLFITLNCAYVELWTFVTMGTLNARYDSTLLKIVSFTTHKIRDFWEFQNASETVQKVNNI